MITPDEQVKIIFDRLRAQLLGTIEALSLESEQKIAAKRMVKDRTSESWNKITDLLNTLNK